MLLLDLYLAMGGHPRIGFPTVTWAAIVTKGPDCRKGDPFCNIADSLRSY